VTDDPMSQQSKPNASRIKWPAVSLYVLLMMILIVLDHSEDIFASSECDSISHVVRFWYQKLCTAGHRKPRPHFVTIIQLPTEMDKCEARRYMAALLPALAGADPAIIVIDKWYTAGCDEVTNNHLIITFDQITQRVPTVVALPADSPELLLANGQELRLKDLRKMGFGPDDLIKGRNLLESVSKLRFGLAFGDCDNRKIPLTWQIFLSDEDVKHHNATDYPTLAAQAAIAKDSEVLSRIKPYLDSKVDPFTSFITAEEFKPMQSSEVCSADKLGDCALPKNWQQSLRGRVLLLAEFSAGDTHNSAIDKVSGSLLQANYIESLLDDRYMRPFPGYLEILLALIGFAMIEGCFDRAEGHNHPAFLFASAVIVILIATSYLSVILFARFFTFWFPLPFALVLRYIGSLKDWKWRSK
jgi:hypothetical protein